MESPGWIKKLVASKAWIVAQVLLSFVLVLSMGSITGIILWEAIKGTARTVMASPEIFMAAVVGAAISTVGLGLFSVVLGMFGPILSVVYEDWTSHIAPVVGGTVGAAIGGGLAASVIYVVALSALTGGIALLFYRMLTAKKRITFKGTTELVIAGVGFGVVNGAIVAAAFKALEVTVGIGWLVVG